MEGTTTFIGGRNHFLVKPMFEVFCISIHPEDIRANKATPVRDEDPFAVHGVARVLDEDGTIYHLYNREANDLEVVPFGGFLSLAGFQIVPFKALKFSIMLYDRTRDIEIANGVFDLDYSKAYDYNRVHVQKVEGQHGYVSVHHATFQHAITASVDLVELHKQADASDLDSGLSGTISARLKRIYGNPSYDANTEFPSTILFDNRRYADKSKYAPAQFDTPIKPFRSCVAVPIDCSLVIEADFCDSTGRKIAIDIQLGPSPGGSGEDIVADQRCEMRVKVHWRHGYDVFPRETRVTDNNDSGEVSKAQVSCDAEQPSTLCDLLSNVEIEENNTMPSFPKAQQPSSSISRRQPRAAIPALPSCVEVFSILICADIKGLDIYGKIEISDSSSCPFYIFDGSGKLDDRKTLPVVGPTRSFDDDPFTMDVDLKDGKGSVSKGFFRWDCNDSDSVSLYDRHICSAIRGDIGYAVAHYSMITYGARIFLKMVFRSPYNPRAFVNVYGRITAHYKNYRYQTPYDEQYYKFTLFSKPVEESVLVQYSSALPLLKSVVSVPLDDTLILDVNLKASGPFADPHEKTGDVGREMDLNAVLEFNADVERYFEIPLELPVAVDVLVVSSEMTDTRLIF